MRGVALAALAVLAGCNPGITPSESARNEAVAPANAISVSAPQNRTNEATPAQPVNSAQEGGATPGVAGMSPYRRREYERGYRDCMTGNFDRERQGESYRIGCMAAEDVKQRR